MLAPDALLQNRYLIIRPIGKGGMGAVYEARDQRLGNIIALKETFFEDETLRKAFEREARLLAGLRHPALPRVIDHFTEGAGQFLVMEFIPGSDLEEMFKERGGPFPLSDVMKWGDQLLDALDYLHTQETPIIHRDIKPQNLKLAARGQIILLDFGLAKGSAAGMSQASASGSIFGYTPTYAPLEQVHGAGTDTRSDLYSLAATLYHLLTGAKPPDALARASAVIGGQPDPLRPATELNPQIPLAVANVLARAMALHGDQRPATAEEMRLLLKEAAAQPLAPAASASDGATIIIPPQADGSAARPVQTATGSDVTMIDAPSVNTVEKSSTATLIEEEPVEPERSETPTTQRETPAPLVESPAPPAQIAAQPAPRHGSNRLVLVAAGVALLLIAGIVIYAVTGGFSPGADVQGSNNATVAVNQNPAAPSPSRNRQAEAAAAGDRRKEATPQPSRAETAAAPSSEGSGAATDRRTVLPRPATKKQTIRERLRPRP
ncbi:MAG TPA: protein kinase [Pyrinomonadaceae bacterium]